MLELILPKYFEVTASPPDYHYAESKFYAGNISRLSLSRHAKPSTLTITVRPLTYSYYMQLNEFYKEVRNTQNFLVNRDKLIEKNKTLLYMLPLERLFYFKEAFKFDESVIGHSKTIPSLIITLEESYEIIPVPPVVIPSARSLTTSKLITPALYIP